MYEEKNIAIPYDVPINPILKQEAPNSFANIGMNIADAEIAQFEIAWMK